MCLYVKFTVICVICFVFGLGGELLDCRVLYRSMFVLFQVSGDCELLQINKKFFMKHCDDAIYSLIRLKVKLIT